MIRHCVVLAVLVLSSSINIGRGNERVSPQREICWKRSIPVALHAT